jgi:hypothetical protein
VLGYEPRASPPVLALLAKSFILTLHKAADYISASSPSEASSHFYF